MHCAQSTAELAEKAQLPAYHHGFAMALGTAASAHPLSLSGYAFRDARVCTRAPLLFSCRRIAGYFSARFGNDRAIGRWAVLSECGIHVDIDRASCVVNQA